MDLKLQGKRALVTGSTRGIGRAVAAALAQVAAKVEELASHLEVIDRKIRLYCDEGEGCETAA